jgi:hypothetical protein
VNSQLDEIRYKLPKFVCLNDDMNKTQPNEKVVKSLHQFYNWYFPEISQFELPQGKMNKFLHIDDFEKPTKMMETIVINLILVFIILMALVPLLRK